MTINVRNLETSVKDIGIKFVKGQVCHLSAPSLACLQHSFSATVYFIFPTDDDECWVLRYNQLFAERMSKVQL